MSSSTHDDHDRPDDHGTNENPETPASDAELIQASRAGDTTAYGTLFARHEHALRRMSECLLGRTAEDLVLFAYTHGFDELRGGDGPSDAIRPFLLRAMMRHCADADTEATGSVPGPAENQTLHDLYEQSNQAYRLVARNTYPVSVSAPQPEHDSDADDEEQRAALDAAVNVAVLTMYEDLADDWRLVIWHGEVEEERPEALAMLLGIRTEDAYVLRHRARHTMRQFALSQYLASTRPARCRYAVDRLDSYDRDELEPLEGERVAGHLNECTECAMLYEQVRAIASRLPEIVAGGLLGEHTETYLHRSTRRRRPGGWAAARLTRLRAALRHRNRGHALSAFGVASSVLVAMVGGVLVFQPDVSLRPTPALDTAEWTPWDFPVGPSSYDISTDRDGSGADSEAPGHRARPNPGTPGDSGGGSWFSDGDSGGEQEGDRRPGTPSSPSVPSNPSDPSDPSTPPDPPSPTTPPDDPTPTSPPSDDPTVPPSDPPTDDPTDQPTDPPSDPPTDPPTDDPTTPPTDTPSPTGSPTPSLLPA